MWQSARMRAPYSMREIELTESLVPISLQPQEGGAHVLVRHAGRPVGRFWLTRSGARSTFNPEDLTPHLRESIFRAVAHLLCDRLPLVAPPELPNVTIAVCTRNRPKALCRCLAALIAHRDAEAAGRVDILVVDNAPPDAGTRRAVRSFPDVRYVVEPVPGLDIARNRALAETDRDWLAFVDDDAVIDRRWLRSLAEGAAESPDAGAFTGPVLPLMLETEAQLRFERAGGFGNGFAWTRFCPARWGDRAYPAGKAAYGTGASMVFSTAVLRALGGFDDALDTGPPLPGGGDIDILYRILRSGRTIVYLPGLLVHHEHRRQMPELAALYRSWGEALMALHGKNYQADVEMRSAHRRYLRRWLRLQTAVLLRALAGLGPKPPSLVLAEIRGGAAGFFGGYRRSQLRMAERKRTHAQ
jgi:GT2 family glycosyltransferase